MGLGSWLRRGVVGATTGLLRQGTRRGEGCGAQRGRRAGFGRVAGAVEADPGVYRGKASCGEARARVGGCACGLRAASAAGVGGRTRAAWGCGVGGMRGLDEARGRERGHRA